MKKFTSALLLTLVALQCAQAVDASRKSAASEPAKAAAAATPGAAETGAVPTTGIELKNKSSFAMENTGRNPFWPIGWKPAAKVTNNPNEVAAGPEISPSAFLVSSIMTGQSNRFAIINGKPMSEGQVFGLQMGTQIYQITVRTIDDGQVTLERGGQQFVVPLRRR